MIRYVTYLVQMGILQVARVGIVVKKLESYSNIQKKPHTKHNENIKIQN